MDDHIGNVINLTEALKAFCTQPNPASEVTALFNKAITTELNSVIKAQSKQETN